MMAQSHSSTPQHQSGPLLHGRWAQTSHLQSRRCTPLMTGVDPITSQVSATRCWTRAREGCRSPGHWLVPMQWPFWNAWGFPKCRGCNRGAPVRWPLREEFLPFRQRPIQTPVLRLGVSTRNQCHGIWLVPKVRRKALCRCWPPPPPLLMRPWREQAGHPPSTTIRPTRNAEEGGPKPRHTRRRG